MDIAPYLQRINKWNPDIDLGQIRVDPYGLNNLVIIVANKWVFRFPRNAESKSSLVKEAEILALVRNHVGIKVPGLVYSEELEMGSYPMLGGVPLYRHDLLRLPREQMESFAAEVAQFLVDLHAIPLDGWITLSGHNESPRAASRQNWQDRLAEFREELYRYLWADQHAYIEDLFAPVIDGQLDLDSYTPALIHNDLASYHLLVDSSNGHLTGVLDFGEAMVGDPATDYGALISTYGETLIHMMMRFNPSIKQHLDRARFRASYLELEWALKGVRTNNPEWFLVHIGRA